MVDETNEGRAERPRILVVDDQPAVRNFLRVILERLNYEVETASGGAEALKMAGRKCYDVVLTDLIMPRVDGLEVIRRVKELSPETEVVAITGYPSSETIVAATRAGAIDYLPKSPDPEHLAVLLEKALEIRQLRRKASERDLYLRMAQMDGLTELLNHRTFHGLLEREFNRAKRSTLPLSVIFADLDGFKAHNDDYGHLFGDRVLREVAGVLRASCRSYDVVARFGGDEFAVLAPDTAHEGGQILGARIGGAVRELDLKGMEAAPRLSVSVGVATYPLHASEATELLERADVALYEAKRNGGGIVCSAE